MAKLYDFRFTTRRATFFRAESGNVMVTVPYGSSSDVYHESCAQMTFADAKAKLDELSKAEPRDHKAFLTMQYRDDTKPRGFGAGYSVDAWRTDPTLQGTE